MGGEAKDATEQPPMPTDLMRFDGRRTLFDPISKRTTADDCPKRAKAVEEAERRVRR